MEKETEREKYYKRALHIYEIDIFDMEIYHESIIPKRRSKTGR